MIEINHLSKTYSKKARGIIDVSLTVKPGEIFGFIGPNGAGKSTTVRALLNLIFPTSGTARVNGLDIIKDSIEIRKDVGYIPSEVHFYASMNVQDFLDYSGRFYERPFKARQKELVEILDLDVTRKIDALSFGNKKKVAIVAAMQHQPSFYILDEPTSGLDPLHQNTFFELILEEKKRGATIFFSSHILSEVERICDRIGIIKEGQLIQVDTIESIQKARVKKVKLRTKEPFKSTSKYIKDFEDHGNQVSFVYTGPLKQLLKILDAQSVIDVTISDPSLEEIFMHVYQKGAVQ